MQLPCHRNKTVHIYWFYGSYSIPTPSFKISFEPEGYVLIGHLMISGFYYLSSSATMSVCWGKKGASLIRVRAQLICDSKVKNLEYV